MTGNRLGPRGDFLYKSDSGEIYIVETDLSLAIAGFGLGADAPVAYDPETPGTARAAPSRFQPRIVYVQATDGARKAMIAFDPTASAYARNNAASYTIDAEPGWVSTGRRGEKQTF